jgi:hypothetical protein
MPVKTMGFTRLVADEGLVAGSRSGDRVADLDLRKILMEVVI